jgi:hypothetical protein
MFEKYEISLENAAWRKSSFSGNDGGNCVELAALPNGHVGVRDSKNPDGGVQVYSPAEWAAFRAGMDAGEFDNLGNPQA